MNSWAHLPKEILVQIFNQAQESDDLLQTLYGSRKKRLTLCQCQLTCKDWLLQAKSIIYRNVVFREDRKKSVEIFIYNLTNQGLSLGRYVRSIQFNNLISTKEKLADWKKRDMFTHLANYCVNLQEIKAVCIEDEFYSMILSERMKGNWKRLTELPRPSKAADGIYLLAAMACRNTIRRLDYFVDNLKTINPSKIYDSLKAFQNLTILHLSFTRETDLSTLDPVLGSLPLLQDVVIRESGQGYFLLNSNISRNETVEDLSTWKPCLKVTRFRTNFSLDKKAIEYIMQKFPNLVRFDATSHSMNERPTTDLPKKLSMQFMDFITKLNSATVDVSLRSLEPFEGFMHALSTSNKRENVELRIGFGAYKLEDNPDNRFKFNILIDFDDDYKEDSDICLYLTVKEIHDQTIAPYFEILSSICSKVNMLSIQSYSITIDDDFLHYYRTMVSERILHDILRLAPDNLKELEIGCDELLFIDDGTFSSMRCLEKLKFRDCVISDISFKALFLYVESLTSLMIAGCLIRYEEVIVASPVDNVVSIMMPKTCIQQMRLMNVLPSETFTDLVEVYFHTVTSKGEKYFVFDETGKTEITAEIYQSNLDNDNGCICVDIQCKALNRLEVHYKDIGSFSSTFDIDDSSFVIEQ